MHDLWPWAFAILVSVSVHLATLFYIRNLKRSRRKLTMDASELLRQLMGSGAVMKITLIDPGSFMMLSPRDHHG